MMNLNDEQTMLVRTIQQLAEREFTERAFTWDGDYPWENMRLLGKQGFLGVNLPEEYGGGGMSDVEALLVLEAAGTVCPDTAYALYMLTLVAPRAVEMFGTEEARRRYLPPVCEGESVIAIAISEPHAGSDAGAMNTHVTEENGELRLHGEKIWVSVVPEADAAVVWARFPDDQLGTVIMDFDAPGVDVVEEYRNMAGHTQTHFFMEEVPVPPENVLVRGKQALKQQLRALNWERLGSAAFTNTLARLALDHALDYAAEREQFDRPLKDFQGMRWKLADMTKKLEASRSLAYRAAAAAPQHGGTPDRLEASLAKLYAGEMAETVISESLQVFGSAGYQKEHPLEYLYRLQRGRRIAAGTDELMKNNIADVILERGLPELG